MLGIPAVAVFIFTTASQYPAVTLLLFGFPVAWIWNVYNAYTA